MIDITRGTVEGVTRMGRGCRRVSDQPEGVNAMTRVLSRVKVLCLFVRRVDGFSMQCQEDEHGRVRGDSIDRYNCDFNLTTTHHHSLLYACSLLLLPSLPRGSPAFLQIATLGKSPHHSRSGQT